MSSQVAENKRKRRNAAYRVSITVAVMLGIITAIEYVAALFTSSPIILFLLALVKAYLVVVYFMHVRRVWGGEGEH